jgi:hypothetical protein
MLSVPSAAGSRQVGEDGELSRRSTFVTQRQSNHVVGGIGAPGR